MRPIDLNNLIPKTQEISKLQQLENNKHKNFMHNQSTTQNKKFENELKKVNTTSKTYKPKINKDEKDNNKNKSFKEKDGQEEKEKEQNKNSEVVSDGIIGSKVDIKI
ncbi:hypothetical protein SAMN05660462_01015 [Proteiniborus ethanoligenes]|uniref:Uncharacterized protein n=1 Tax=Proteiniborus ethanoligenes TaxID=415015 RepID=A0A1H3N504_9FIRM|nr:hypothetical protein [Proteiniborus ethanoligenes]TAH63175.1 MAG: hypothetical protein EWM50_03595 [Gottschalkiaceae bacterium]SDY84041.1 hypothetical protein SAMN05660462_01015 [Proteiniborus ethanoligenes]